MKIINFIESECQKFKDFDDKNKAQALLKSVNVQIDKNNRNVLFNPKTDVVKMFSAENQHENYLKWLLEFYQKNNSFDIVILPDKINDKEKQAFEEIKKHLKGIFKSN